MTHKGARTDQTHTHIHTHIRARKTHFDSKGKDPRPPHGLTVLVQKDMLWLDISMDQPAAVAVRHGLQCVMCGVWCAVYGVWCVCVCVCGNHVQRALVCARVCTDEAI